MPRAPDAVSSPGSRPRLVRALLTLLALLLVAAPARAASPQDAVKEFLLALYTGDRQGFLDRVLPDPDAERLLPPQPAERKDVEADLERIDLHPESPYLHEGRAVSLGPDGDAPVGTTAQYSAGFRGSLLVIPVERTGAGWKVDLRFWLAAGHESPENSPEVAARKFLYFLMTRNREELVKVTPSGFDLAPLLTGPAPFEDQYFELAVEMPMTPAREGEYLVLPDGSVVRAPAGTPDHAWFVGQYGVQQLPFELVREGSTWRVVPRDYLPAFMGR